MRITQKITLALGLAFAALCALLWAALQFSIAPQFAAFELEKAQDNFQRAHNAINRELDQLEAYRRDYGVWNDAYEFISGEYPEFLEEELPLSILQELSLNIYIYLSADGSIIDGVAIDGPLENEVNVSAYAPVRFADWKGFQEKLTAADATQTIIKTRAGLMLIAYAPVTRTDGSGDYVGHLLTGRLIDAGFIAQLQKQTRVDMTVHPASADAAVMKTVEQSGDFVTVSETMTGADGVPIARLVARTPGDITAIGQHTILSTFLWITGVALLFIAIVSTLLKWLAIRPLERLTAIMKSADASKPPIDPRLKARKDEIGVLYSSFNNLLDRIDRNTKELAGALTAAEAAERAKAQFLANMSHEIRTPMNGMLGMAELLAETKLSDTQKSFVDVIVKSGDALLTIINDILDFSKLDAGMASLNTAPFVLADVVDDVTSLVAAKANEKGLELAVRIDPALSSGFVGDAGRLRQILINLTGNAVKFTDKGHVLVDVSAAAGPDDERTALKFSVIDTGIGIPAEKCAEIFEKFSQADNSTTRAHEGTGLGLAIAKALVELMGGEIGVDSKPGAGSAFWFTIALQATAQTAPEEAPAADIGGARLLIVDDNEVNRRILEEQAAAWGAAAASCDNGAAALTLMKEAHERKAAFDAVIMDYHMPVMNGAETVRRLRADAAIGETPVVMLAAVDKADAGDEFETLGVNAYLTKPARSATLQRVIGQVLRRAPGAVPAKTEEAATSAPTPAPAEASGAVDVLVVEDNEVNQLVMSYILKGAGYAFDTAANGREAVEKFRALKPKLILMDVSMPEMSGLEATAEIRRLEEQDGERRTPIIGVTAHAVNGDCDDCYASGMDDYVPKPVSPEKLAAKIAEHLKAASQAA